MLTVVGASPVRADEPFPWSSSNAVQVVDLGGNVTADDVIGDLSNSNILYCARTGSGYRWIHKYVLSRDAAGQVIGGSQVWQSEAALSGANLGLKSLDMFNADTIFYTLEQGGASSHGLVGRITGLVGAPTHAEAANTATTAYNCEGIAVDRTRNLLYVMNDDDSSVKVAQYGIDAGTLALTHRWTATLEAGNNGNDGIVLSDGRVAAVAGTTSVNIYAVPTNGAPVVNLLGGAVSGGNTPQDLLLYDDYLYLAWQNGLIQAFDATNLDAMNNTVAWSWDVRALLAANIDIGGIDVTTEGHLLIGTRGDASLPGRVFLFPSTRIAAEPPESLILKVW